MDRFRCQRNHL